MTWHTVAKLADNVYRISEPVAAILPQVGVATVNTYLLIGGEGAALIDTGLGIGDIRAVISRLTSVPCTVLNTHYHWDHIGANSHFAECVIHESEADLLLQEPDLGSIRLAMNAPAARAVLPPSFDPDEYRVFVPSGGRPLVRTVQDNDVIDLGGLRLTVLHIPGHSPGHLAYLDEASGWLFTGDSAYQGPVFACFQGGDATALVWSAERLASLRGVTTVCPGHDDVITDPLWLGEFSAGVESAVSGRAQGRVREGFVVGREFSFDTFSVWLPA
jgi:glyoxylase-like metal-dependent hydrolase (beta-lactamase superfamily II)